MSSTPTTRNRFDKQAYGDNPDLWGISNINTDLDLIDESLDGLVTIATADTTGGTYTLNAVNYATDQARRRVLNITSALTSNLTLVIPNCEKWYIVNNATSGAYTLTIKTSGGTGVAVTQGCEWVVRCDGVGSGTCTIVTMPPNLLPLASGTLNMNTQKITGLVAGASASDAVRYDQLPGTPYYTDQGTKTADFLVAATGNEFTANLVSAAASFKGTLYASPSDKDRFKITVLADNSHTFTLNGTTNTVKINNQSVDATVQSTCVIFGHYDSTTGTWVVAIAPVGF